MRKINRVGNGILVRLLRREGFFRRINVVIGFFKKFNFLIRILDACVLGGIFFMKLVLN